MPTVHETNFYLDRHGVRLPEPGNPFYMPEEGLSRLLVQRFLRTVYNSFPMIPKSLEDQLQIYYHSAQNGHAMMFPPRWYATINLVFAIGARLLCLTGSDWPSSTLDETVYVSRVYELLGVNTTVLAPPDLPLIQVTGLLAFYYMSIGHINRAWVTVGTAMRHALAFGLHVHNKCSSADPEQQQVMAQL